MKNIITAGLAMAALSAWPAPATSHDKHAHETWSAGEPGNRQKPSRTIEVEMSEMDIHAVAHRGEARRADPLRDPQCRQGRPRIPARHHEREPEAAEEMKKHPHMEHDDPNGVRLAPAKSAEIVWKFTHAGTFEYSCLIPDHRDYGMIGQIQVNEATVK